MPENPRFPVLAVALPDRSGGDALLMGYRNPRTTVLVTGPGGSPGLVARSAAREVRPGATVVLGEAGSRSAEFATCFGALSGGAEPVVADPADLLRFFWCYRDAHDPLALGHASDRTLFGDFYYSRALPDARGARGRGARARKMERLRRLVLDTGSVLGVRPPLPEPGARGWGRDRRLHLFSTCLLYYAGLLLHWRSPLAWSPAPGRLALADRWLRERAGAGKA